MERLIGMRQTIEQIPPSDSKFTELTDRLLRLRAGSQVIIFVATHDLLTNFIDYYSTGRGPKPIFGDRWEHERQSARNWFNRRLGGVVVAQHVSARALQLPNVTQVIVFDIPNTIEEYADCVICARTPTNGKATVMIDSQDLDSDVTQEILRVLRK